MADTLQIWSNSTAQDGWFHEAGNIKSGLVAGVMSCSMLDIENYTGETYRDIFTGSNQGATVNSTQYAYSGVGIQQLLTDIGAAVTPIAATTDPAATAEETMTNTGKYSLSDEVGHITPRKLNSTRSLLKFWSAATGTGNVLYAVWADKFISFEVSTTAPTYI